MSIKAAQLGPLLATNGKEKNIEERNSTAGTKDLKKSPPNSKVTNCVVVQGQAAWVFLRRDQKAGSAWAVRPSFVRRRRYFRCHLKLNFTNQLFFRTWALRFEMLDKRKKAFRNPIKDLTFVFLIWLLPLRLRKVFLIWVQNDWNWVSIVDGPIAFDGKVG